MLGLKRLKYTYQSDLRAGLSLIVVNVLLLPEWPYGTQLFLIIYGIGVGDGKLSHEVGLLSLGSGVDWLGVSLG